jgi:alkanesulfonate monooxygenase SsuD/methylene tetrahydromethanopterin reductase-like flavin-dependent oxidoreductase (luciferase family)
VKFTYLQHIPHRYLPDDLAARCPEPVADTPYFGAAGPRLVHGDIRVALDEAMHAVRAGFDAIALTEHRRSCHDTDPNPDLAAAALAYQIGAENLNTGLHVIGRSLGKTREPLRVAEELAWLDNLSDGRLMTGFCDANVDAGSPPIETRARYDENLSFVLRAWTARGPFAWNGKYSQYDTVNVWPRPFQLPHPPVSVTGTGNPNTTRLALQRDFGFNHVVLGGASASADRVFDDLWLMADELGVDDNPFRANVGQYVLIADTDAEAERLYTEHVSHGSTRGIGHTPMHRLVLPAISFGELVDSGAIVAGSVATVRDRLADRARSYRVGNMLLSLQTGSMSTDLVKHNIDLFASGVMPYLRGIWSEYEDTNHWWPARLGGRPVSAVQAQQAGARLTWRRHSVC